LLPHLVPDVSEQWGLIGRLGVEFIGRPDLDTLANADDHYLARLGVGREREVGQFESIPGEYQSELRVDLGFGGVAEHAAEKRSEPAGAALSGPHQALPVLLPALCAVDFEERANARTHMDGVAQGEALMGW